jgi:protein O-GlcNAc transferase
MPNLSLQDAIQLALRHHQAGQLREAESIYRQILQLHPNQPDALHLLGVAMQQSGNTTAAIEFIQKAIAADPRHSAFYNNLGNVLRHVHRNAEAIAAYRKAIELAPDAADPRRNLAMLLIASAQAAEAIAEFEALLRQNPNSAEDWNSLGNLLSGQTRLSEALAAFDNALRLRPDFPEALSNRGDVLLGLGQADAAVEACEKALALRPDFADPYNNLGNALRAKGRTTEAIEAYRRATALNPNLGPTYGNLANALSDQGEVKAAEEAYRDSVRLQPDAPQAHSNFLTHLNACDYYTPEQIFAEHQKWNELHARRLIVSKTHTNLPDPERRLRIGYVSPDFRQHSVAYFAQTFLSKHDHERFEIYCYADEHLTDATTQQLRGYADHWRTITPLSDAQLADLVRQDEIDILIDLTGHTAGNRLLAFAQKPAPIQISYLGYPATTGLSAMDYRITDALADPPGETERFHTENLIRLPNCFLCYRISDDLPAINPHASSQEAPLTFGCFNNLVKLSDSTLHLWSKVLAAIPNSRLVLKFRSLADEGSRQLVTDRLKSHGIPPHQLDFLPHTKSYLDHLNDYNRVDIALDPFPYNGTTTTCEAFAMGVPVITLAGQTHAARVGVSLLTNAGYPELIAASPNDYIDIARRLAADPSALAQLRTGLRDRLRSSPLCNETSFTRSLESAYRQIWRTWCMNRA